MSKAKEMRAKYGRQDLDQGARGKYFKKFQDSSNVVVLDEDIAEVFPNSQAVNEALRGLINLAHGTGAQ